MKRLLGVIVLALLLGLGLSGTIMSHVEEPKYKVILKDGDIEIRQYFPFIVAEVEVPGERKEAIREGFKELADYIFGNNVSSKQIDMTAPLSQQEGEKIAMTAPVTQSKQGNLWKVRFVMPEGYTLQTLPKPNSDKVQLLSVPAKQFAVIQFSGTPTDERLKTHADLLNQYLNAHQFKELTTPIYAFYNPPWTLPFLRRNEVLVEVGSSK